jgi:hypothetical protein
MSHEGNVFSLRKPEAAGRAILASSAYAVENDATSNDNIDGSHSHSPSHLVAFSSAITS